MYNLQKQHYSILQGDNIKIKIKKLASVQMGYSFRSRLEPSEGGGVAVIQMKDLLDDNTVWCNDLIKIDASSPEFVGTPMLNLSVDILTSE